MKTLFFCFYTCEVVGVGVLSSDIGRNWSSRPHLHRGQYDTSRKVKRVTSKETLLDSRGTESGEREVCLRLTVHTELVS